MTRSATATVLCLPEGVGLDRLHHALASEKAKGTIGTVRWDTRIPIIPSKMFCDRPLFTFHLHKGIGIGVGTRDCERLRSTPVHDRDPLQTHLFTWLQSLHTKLPNDRSVECMAA